MSYHIVSIDTPQVSLSCRKGQLTCRESGSEEIRTIPMEDVAAIIVTSFSANVHSRVMAEAARLGVALIFCESYRPTSILLPANRSTDTLLTRAHLHLKAASRNRLWTRTVDAKTLNQLSLARHLASDHSGIPALESIVRGRGIHKESKAARCYWKIFGDAVSGERPFTRDRDSGGLNSMLNFGYAILLSAVLQKLFAVGLDPTAGICHVMRERATPLAYDLMEPFRPCVDWKVVRWVRSLEEGAEWAVNDGFRKEITCLIQTEVPHQGSAVSLGAVLETVVRSFRRAVLEDQPASYQPWTQGNSKWAG